MIPISINERWFSGRAVARPWLSGSPMQAAKLSGGYDELLEDVVVTRGAVAVLGVGHVGVVGVVGGAVVC